MQYEQANTSRDDQHDSLGSQARDTTGCHNGRCLWICQVCGGPIQPGSGYVEIVNLDPAVGPVGDEPFEPTQDFNSWVKENHPEHYHDSTEGVGWLSVRDLISLGDEWEKHRRVGFKALHSRCDPTPDSDGYCVDVEEIGTDRDFIRLVHHLSGKNWMGIEDLREMLELWPIHTERGSATWRPGVAPQAETAGQQEDGSNENG